MRKILATFALTCALAFSQQYVTPLTNEVVINMVRAGVPASTIIQTINSSVYVSFRFQSNDLAALSRGKVPEDVVRAMTGRVGRAATPPVVAVTSAPPTPSPAAPPAPQAPPVPAASPGEYQSRGKWDVDFNASATIPHATGASKIGIVSGTLGYFVSRGSEVGALSSGLFVNGAQDVVLGGFYRYYFRTPSVRLLPYLGAGAGTNIAHASGVGTQSNFGAIGTAGLRIFVAPRIAFEAQYNLIYLRIKGVGFQDSSESQLSFGFAHVFGGRR